MVISMKDIAVIVVAAFMLIAVSSAFVDESPIVNDTILIQSGAVPFEISGTEFEDYNFFGGSDSGLLATDLGGAGITTSIRNVINEANSDIKASTNPNVPKKMLFVGSSNPNLVKPPTDLI